MDNTNNDETDVLTDEDTLKTPESAENTEPAANKSDEAEEPVSASLPVFPDDAMANKLPLYTLYSEEVTVVSKYDGENIYSVSFRGYDMELVWLSEPQLYDGYIASAEQFPASFISTKLISMPCAVTEMYPDGSFGYIRQPIPKAYAEFSSVIYSKSLSSQAAGKAALTLCAAFHLLHRTGHTVLSLPDSRANVNNSEYADIYISKKDGNCQLVFPGCGKTRFNDDYRAPEQLNGYKGITSGTDCWFLSFILFNLFCGGHPLCGMRYLCCPIITDNEIKHIYGSSPLFIFDPDNDSNRADPILQKEITARWELLPEFIKEYFIKSFDTDSLCFPDTRTQALTSFGVFTKLYSGYKDCTCGNPLYICPESLTVCDNCKKRMALSEFLQTDDSYIPLISGKEIFRYQLDSSVTDERMTDKLFTVLKDKDGTTVLYNETGESVKAFTPSGKEKLISPGDVIPCRSGIKISIFDTSVQITSVEYKN